MDATVKESAGAIDEAFVLMVKAVEERFGMRLQTGHRGMLVKAAQEALARGEVDSIAELTSRVFTGADHDPMVRRMREVAAIGETYFFRSIEQLHAMEQLVLSSLVEPRRNRARKTLRIWSAACSTGEEAYTLAIMFRRLLPDFELFILGTDMNEAALEAARAGMYRSRSFRQTNVQSLEGFIRKEGDVWEVVPEIKRLVSFTRLNLVTDPFPSVERGICGFDVVLCRNVLIYMDATRLPGVMARISAACAPRSILVLSPSEYSAARHAVDFEVRSRGVLERVPARRKPVRATPSKPHAVQPSARHPVRAEVSQKSVLPPADPFESALERARTAADGGRFEEAHALATSALTLRPDSPQPYFLLAAMWTAARQPGKAAVEYQRALFLDRNSVAAEIGLGQALSMEGRDPEARRHFERARRMLESIPPDDVVKDLGITATAAMRLAHSGEGGR